MACRVPVSDVEEYSGQAVRECQRPGGCKDVPSHIVVYDDMANKIAPFLEQYKYQLDFEHLQNQFEQVYVRVYRRF
jgi:hypothetical protein